MNTAPATKSRDVKHSKWFRPTYGLLTRGHRQGVIRVCRPPIPFRHHGGGNINGSRKVISTTVFITTGLGNLNQAYGMVAFSEQRHSSNAFRTSFNPSKQMLLYDAAAAVRLDDITLTTLPSELIHSNCDITNSTEHSVSFVE